MTEIEQVDTAHLHYSRTISTVLGSITTLAGVVTGGRESVKSALQGIVVSSSKGFSLRERT